MKSIKRRILPFVLVVCCLNMFSLPIFAATPATPGDLYAQEATEIVNIDGVDYTYHYYYNEDGNRAISVTNNANSTTEVLTYDEATATILLNDEILGMVSQAESQQSNVTLAEVPLEYIGSESCYVSWAMGTTTAIVAGAIVIGLGALGVSVAVVIAAMGVGALGILAASAIGGTVNMDFYRFFAPPAPTRHECYWSFTASTGDYYGRYLYLY